MPIIRALANRNFRLYFSGQIVSVIGTWMQQIALSWLVYRLTYSTAMLGLVSFAGQTPNLFLAPLGGVISDRYPRRRLLLATTAAQAVQALVLAALVHAGAIGPAEIVAMALLLGIINGIDQPIRAGTGGEARGYRQCRRAQFLALHRAAAWVPALAPSSSHRTAIPKSWNSGSSGAG